MSIKKQSLSMQIVIVATGVIALLTAILALSTHLMMSDFATENALHIMRGQAEAVRSMLSLSYDSEHERTLRNLKRLASFYEGKLEVSPGTEGSPPVGRLNGEMLNENTSRLERFYAEQGLDGTLILRRGDEFYYVANFNGGKPYLQLHGKPLLPLGRLDVKKGLLAGETVIGVAARDGSYAMVGYIPLKDAEGRVVAALGMRTPLQNTAIKGLRETLGKLKVGKTGYLYAVAPEPKGDAVRLPLHPTLEGKVDTELPDSVREVFRKAMQIKDGHLIYDWINPDGSLERKIGFYAYSDKWDWVVAVSAPVSDFVEETLKVRNILIAVALLFGMLLVTSLYFVIRGGLTPLSRVVEGLKAVEQGDMSIRLPEGPSGSRNEIDALSQTVNGTVAGVAGLIRAITESVAEVNASAGTQQASAASVAEASEQQSEAAAAMASAVEQMSVSISQVAENARQAAAAAEAASHASDSGRTLVGDTMREMEQLASTLNESAEQVLELGHQSEKIAGIVDVIKGIADQTNLLALNAAIEAARAGEQGRGFAVVADEVRKLAERTSQSTQEIAGMIGMIAQETSSASSRMQDLRSRMGNGVERVRRIDEALNVIDARNREATGVVQDIAAATRDQSEASGDIANRVEAISNMAESNTAISQSNRETARGMRNLAETLHTQVARFRI